jgi:betaine-aldehyde dehydrogenase
MSALTIPARELFINGRWVPPARGQYLDVVSPATEEVIGRIPAGSVEDVEAAVAAAVAANKNGSWGRSTGKQRAVVLRALAQKVQTALHAAGVAVEDLILCSSVIVWALDHCPFVSRTATRREFLSACTML